MDDGLLGVSYHDVVVHKECPAVLPAVQRGEGEHLAHLRIEATVALHDHVPAAVELAVLRKAIPGASVRPVAAGIADDDVARHAADVSLHCGSAARTCAAGRIDHIER